MTRRITALPAGAAPALSLLHAACFPDDPWDAAALGRILALSGVAGHLAWEGEAPAGFLLARDLGGEIEILSLGVVPELRRCGIARALLDALVADARRLNIGSIVLEVAADNEAARRLYAAFAFRRVGRRPRYYCRADGVVDALILRREITSEATPR